LLIYIIDYFVLCVGQRQFHDQYFDTSAFNLTLKDMWLRKRKGCWELKCPASLCSRYQEITDLSKSKRQRNAEEQCLSEDESWLKELNLGCFAEFTTVRRSFTVDEDGVQIDLDQADFGYSVGEIEVIVSDGGDVQSALEKIRKTAERLGELTDEQKTLLGGKMNVFLKRHRPEHYEELLKEHVL
uniref:Thiamine triphosphatase n=1 Tax=Sphaeramia orbicularis TaxID=375764 RepID=A0A673CM77_9TELE